MDSAKAEFEIVETFSGWRRVWHPPFGNYAMPQSESPSRVQSLATVNGVENSMRPRLMFLSGGRLQANRHDPESLDATLNSSISDRSMSNVP